MKTKSMETKTTNIGWKTAINNGNCISIMLDHGTDNMELVKVEVEHDDFGTPYIPADRVMDLLQILKTEMQEHPLQNLYMSDEYNY